MHLIEMCHVDCLCRYVLSRLPRAMTEDGAYELEVRRRTLTSESMSSCCHQQLRINSMLALDVSQATENWFPPSWFHDDFSNETRYNTSLFYAGPRDSGTHFHTHKVRCLVTVCTKFPRVWLTCV